MNKRIIISAENMHCDEEEYNAWFEYVVANFKYYLPYSIIIEQLPFGQSQGGDKLVGFDNEEDVKDVMIQLWENFCSA